MIKGSKPSGPSRDDSKYAQIFIERQSKKRRPKVKRKSTSEQYDVIEKKIANLRRQQKKLLDKDNRAVASRARRFAHDLRDRATSAELKFMELAEKKGLCLEYQMPIYFRIGSRISQFFIVDFCDKQNKLVFEVDGEYHNDENQQKLDCNRTALLVARGYRVFRITNADVFAGKTTAFLISSYKSIGINL